MIEGPPNGFWWWNDAVEHANRLALLSGRRRRIVWDRIGFVWRVLPRIGATLMAKLKGRLVILQKMADQVDGKIHFVAGVDESVFHLEPGDEFFTAVFTVDPFKAGD